MYSVDKALDILVSKKVVNNKQYWLDNYSKLQNVDNLIIQMANYIEPYKEDNQQTNTNSMITTTATKGNIYEFKNKSLIKSTYGFNPKNDSVRYIKVHPSNFAIWESASINNPTNLLHRTAATIAEIKGYGINGGFFGKGKATINNKETTVWAHAGILAVENKVLCDYASHALPWENPSTWCPQSCLVYYKDGSFGIEVVKNIKEIKSPYYWVIGGIGLTNWNPDREGFKGQFADVLRKTDHSAIGVTEDGYIILARHYQFNRYDTIKNMKDLGCTLAIGLDSGGSTQYRVPDLQRPSFGSDMRPVTSILLARDLML